MASSVLNFAKLRAADLFLSGVWLIEIGDKSDMTRNSFLIPIINLKKRLLTFIERILN